VFFCKQRTTRCRDARSYEVSKDLPENVVGLKCIP
jgi:hypothetical protein